VLGCDNLRALTMSSNKRQQIKPSAACADIHCSLRATKKNFTGGFNYQHMTGHMDKYLLWHQLSLIQQLNCVCDTTVKAAVHRAITTGYTSIPPQTLPQEDIFSIIIWGNKITNNVSQPVRFHASKKLAQTLLTDTRRWPQDQCDEVDWKHLDLATRAKSDMYKMWRSKQHTGFCGTRIQVGRYSGHECPDKK
jgi:hypothetical protein